LTDSIASWRHQDETPYLLDDPPAPAPGSSVNAPLISSEVEQDEQDWGDTRNEPIAGPSSLELGAIDWNDINNEVDAAMNESDDEDEQSEKSARLSEEEDWMDEANSVARWVPSS
jgi:RNA polymerase II subunit A C-terminal domain phosphatase